MAPSSPAPSTGVSDARIVRGLREGRAEAGRELYERYRSMVFGVVIARAPAEDVEDLVQDVFTRALARVDQLHDDRALGGWLAAIARHRVIDHLRTRRPHLTLSEEPAREDAPRLEAARVLAALQRLPEAFAEPLAMRLVAGMTGPEIAERTGMTPGSVRVNLHRGLRKLRSELGLESK